MKKFVIGFIVGLVAMFAGQAGAAQFIGSKVAGTKDVTLNGVTIGQAAIINNSSYVPVRSLANGLGLNIDLEGGKINLADSSAGRAVVEPDPTPAPSQEPKFTESQIDSMIKFTQNSIDFTSAYIKKLEDAGQGNSQEAADLRETLKQKQAELDVWLKRKSELGTP